MRLIRALLALSCLACAPLHDPSGCPKPCPLACPDSCLPSGYCAESGYSQTAPLAIFYLESPLGDLPPDAQVSLSLHAVMDLDDRGDSLPWDYSIRVQFTLPDGGQPDALELAAYNTDGFPVIGDWTTTAVTDGDGIVNSEFLFRCQGRARPTGNGCVLEPGTTLTARVLDVTPWDDPPACP